MNDINSCCSESSCLDYRDFVRSSRLEHFQKYITLILTTVQVGYLSCGGGGFESFKTGVSGSCISLAQFKNEPNVTF